jgi:hypothetical protein
MSALRKLLLGETRVLPAGVATTLAAGLSLKVLADGAAWWHSVAGWVVLTGALIALSASLLPAMRRRR